MAHFFLMQNKMDEASSSTGSHGWGPPQACANKVAKKFFAVTQEANDSLPTEVRSCQHAELVPGSDVSKNRQICGRPHSCICEVAAVTKIQSVHRASQIRSVYHAVMAAVAPASLAMAAPSAPKYQCHEPEG